MNSFVVAVFAVALAAANAGLISHSIIAPVAHGTTLQGPGTKTAISGPDGSHIVATAPGGVVSTAVDAGYVAHTGVVAPVIAHTAPVISHAVPLVAAPVVAHAAPIIAAPVVVAHGIASAPVKTIDPAFVAHGPHGALIAPGTGIEGQYQHDYTETLYDDGAYRGEFLNGHH